MNKDDYDLTVGDEIKQIKEFMDGSRAITQTRYGKLLARNGDKVIVALANFGDIITLELNINEIERA